jgi:hypothetical protein
MKISTCPYSQSVIDEEVNLVNLFKPVPGSGGYCLELTMNNANMADWNNPMN